MTGRIAHDPDLVRRTAEGIVGSPPYRDGEPGVLRRTLTRLADLLGQLLADLAGTVGGTPAVAWIVAGVGLLLLGAVVWYATRGATLGRGAVAALPLGISDRSAAEWEREATERLAAGDLAAGLRARYLAAVVTLIESGVLDDRPGRTIRELDVELAGVAPTVAAEMARAGQRVEQVLFAGRDATGEDVEVARAALAAVRRQGARVRVGSGA